MASSSTPALHMTNLPDLSYLYIHLYTLLKSLCEKLPANYIWYILILDLWKWIERWGAEANLFMTISTGTDTWLWLTWQPWIKICEVIRWWHVSKEGIKSVKDSLCTVNSATADAWSPQDKEARAWNCQNSPANERSKYRNIDITSIIKRSEIEKIQ